MKPYSKAPLPFMGQKRNQLKNIKHVLELMQGSGQITRDTVFIDVFGGSGLVSHNIKCWYPNNRVIWNDYDNYQERLDNAEETERIRKLAAERLAGKQRKGNCEEVRLSKEDRDYIIELIDTAHYLDCTTLSTYFLFTGKYAKSKEELKKHAQYTHVPQTLINTRTYLKGVERVSLDFRELLDGRDEATRENSFLILDPPYLNAQGGNYRSDGFTFIDTLQLIDRIRKPFLFFSHEESEIVEVFNILGKYIEQIRDIDIERAKLIAVKNTQLLPASYDYLLYSNPLNLFNFLQSTPTTTNAKSVKVI